MAEYVDYINMTKTRSEAAFREYLDERGPALERLRDALAADGQDPDALLNGRVESLVPLWRWILSRLAGPEAPGATAPESVPREVWPSWARYNYEQEKFLSLESLFLLDGLVSYLGAVVQGHAPDARWVIARHRIKRYMFNKHPVLISGKGESHYFLPGVPAGDAHASIRGTRESPEDRIARYARALIDEINRGDTEDEEMAAEEPLVEVEDLGDDELRGRELEVSLREDIGHEHSRIVDRMVKALKREDGISRVIREDREVLLVATLTWSTDRLQEWVAGYLEENVRD
jgi:hypothetical protein